MESRAVSVDDTSADLAIRDARLADHETMRAMILSAYREFAGAFPDDVFLAHQHDLADLTLRAKRGRILVADCTNASATNVRRNSISTPTRSTASKTSRASRSSPTDCASPSRCNPGCRGSLVPMRPRLPHQLSGRQPTGLAATSQGPARRGRG
jgi:hypothetical protein